MKIRNDFVTNSSSSSFIISKDDACIEDWNCGCENWNCDCKDKEIDLDYINAVLNIIYEAQNKIDKLNGNDYEGSHDLEIIETSSLTPEKLESFIEEYTGSFRYECSEPCRREMKETGYPDENGWTSCHDYRRCRDHNKGTYCKLIEDLIRESKFIINDFDSVPESVHGMICEVLKAKYYRFA